MGYCTISDVEARAGVTLTDPEEGMINVFINDFSEYLDYEVEAAGKVIGVEPGNVKVSRLKVICAQRAVTKYITRDTQPNAASHTRTIGDISESVSFAGGSGTRVFGDFWLSVQERRFLGISMTDMIIKDYGRGLL